MSTHTTRPEMERFCARTLEVSKMTAIGEHMVTCPECHQLFQGIFQKRRNHAPVVINLSSEEWLRNEHLDYEWLTAYVDGAIEEDEREMREIHLKLCKQCHEEVTDFVAWQRNSESELKYRYSPENHVNLLGRIWEWWNWPKVIEKPIYALTILLALSGVLVLAMLFIYPRSSSREKQYATASPSPSVLVSVTPVISDTVIPPFVPTPTPQVKASLGAQSRQDRPGRGLPDKVTSADEFAIYLRDNNRVVAIDRSERLIGLKGVPLEIKEAVKDFISSEEINRPVALTDLLGNKSDLRGENKQNSFKLLSPTGTVIFEDHPVFRWEKLNGAENYRVYVSDSRSRKVLDSGFLSSAETQWLSTVPLRRDEVYSWTVGAVLNGEEIVSPSVAEPEMKFRVLSEEKMRELNRLKRNTDSHLALGVFYAQAGMLTEAEQEFQKLIKDNPDSTTARRLLLVVRSWR